MCIWYATVQALCIMYYVQMPVIPFYIIQKSIGCHCQKRSSHMNTNASEMEKPWKVMWQVKWLYGQKVNKHSKLTDVMRLEKHSNDL